MPKKVVTFSLSLFFIIFLSSFLRNPQVLESSLAVIGKVESEFLSDEYFEDLNVLFETAKLQNDKWYILDGSKKIAAEAVVNQMMDDLEKKPKVLEKHKNFNRFFETFDRYIRKLDTITERMHFFRNTLNSYSGAPDKLDDMINLAARGKWELFSAKYHRYNYKEINGALNLKFVSADGRFEAVYNGRTGEIVVDPANMGTYNYAPGSANPIKFYMHNKFDKKPWKRWGNIKDFSYENIIVLKSGHGTDEADNNYEEVEGLIKQKEEEFENLRVDKSIP